MADYICYVDKEASTFFNTKLRDKKTNKKIIIQSNSIGRKMAYKHFSLMASSDKGITDRDGKVEILISGTVKRETKSSVVVNIDKKGSVYKKRKVEQ